MSYLKNPYLSFDSENLLIRKNYKVIQSSSKERLFSNYQPTQKPFKNNQPMSSTAAGITSCPKLKNPFSRQILTQRNLNIRDALKNDSPYNPLQPSNNQHQKQLPFPSYNRPQTNRSVSLPKVNNLLYRQGVVIKKTKNQLSQKRISIPYRPHFLSPPSSKNSWNTQRWKRQSQLMQRQRLHRFGPQGLRYNGKLPTSVVVSDNNLNTDYYSRSPTIGMNNSYKGCVQKPQTIANYNIDVRNIIADDDYVQMMGYSFDENNCGFESKYSEKNDGNKDGPLDLRAFDSGYVKKEESFQYVVVTQRIGRESSPPSPPQYLQSTKPKLPYPQQLSFHGKSFYRIKLVS